uniref:Lin1244/Lin1753-like N-terminal domain-containing protein n=1 Tax=viral metagenome TaxID=1070528 RepID=A0A6H1ZEN2_9ZZZZ
MSKKSTYYFPHDYHARHDPKLEKLRMILGCEGVGIYWCLVEMLYEQNGILKLSDIEIYAKSLNANPEILTKVVSDFKLFSKSRDSFFSNPLKKRLKHISLKIEKARASGKLGGEAKAKRSLSEY